MDGKKISESALVFLHSPMPDETNDSGTMHGGHLLKLIDNIGGIVARRHSRSRVVTASLEGMDFLTPINPGELIVLKASINMVGNSSMEMGVRIEVEDMDTGAHRHAGTCYLTFVAVNGEGKPVRVPALILETEEDQRRYAKAQERRRYRKMLRAPGPPLHLCLAPVSYAICHCTRSVINALPDLIREPGRVLAVIGASPAKLCPGLDACSLNLQNVPDEEAAAMANAVSLVVRHDSLHLLPPKSKTERDWRCLALYGPNVMLSQTGILANISSTLANANVSIFMLSTFDGNYLLVQDQSLDSAVSALRERGYVVTDATDCD